MWIEGYSVSKSIGTFADELAFKKKFMQQLKEDTEHVRDVLAIENSVEPGMPDIIVVRSDGRVSFIELKYSRRGVITFKKSQLPWYRRHNKLAIAVLIYNDLTTNIHMMTAAYLLENISSTSFRLEKEDEL